MDNTSDLNLDPDMMTTQGQTPVSTSPSTAPVSTGVIDITPGNNSAPLPDLSSTHVDQAITPNPSVTDITPSSEPESPTAPTLSPPTAPPASNPDTPTTSVAPVSPVEVNINVPAAPAVQPPTPTPLATPASPEVVAPAAPAQPAPAVVVSQTAPATVTDGSFKVDTSSPLYEDPDLVSLTK